MAEHFYDSDQAVVWVSHDATAFDRADQVITVDGISPKEDAS